MPQLPPDYVNHISVLTEELFPDFYGQEGPRFIAFVKAYFQYMEQTNQTLDLSRHLMAFRDIDTTPDAFLTFFKDKYLEDIQFTTASNKRLFVKNSLDFYRSKGTPRSVDLFFRLVYGVNAEVYYPGQDVFRLSDATWVKPVYLEITHTPSNAGLVGKTITGLSSGATAFVDRLVRRQVAGKFIDILYISLISGNFQTNELLNSM